jgi:hypothetical protein
MKKLKKQKVLELKPTQFAVGMLEVDEKIATVRKYSKKQLRKFVDEMPVPVVRSPHQDLYVVDHHHFLSVCFNLGIKKVHVKIIKDFSNTKMSYPQFWKWMFKTRSAYPFCQFGEGPRKALYLPKDIRGLADDPYRSLAWFVRKAGAFESSDKNFAEFQWANFFRARKLFDQYGPRGMPNALIKAVQLAQSPAARRLPGYGKLNLLENASVLKKAKRKRVDLIS